MQILYLKLIIYLASSISSPKSTHFPSLIQNLAATGWTNSREGFRYSIELTARQDVPQSNRKIPLNSDPSQTSHPPTSLASRIFPHRFAYSSRQQQWLRHLRFKCLGWKQPRLVSFRCPRLTCVWRASLTVALRFTVSFSPFLFLSLSLRRDCRDVSGRFESRYPRQQPGIRRTRFHARWPVNKRRDGVSVAAAVDADDRQRFETKMGGFRAVETLASLDYVRGGARLRDDDGMNRCECVCVGGWRESDRILWSEWGVD